MATNDKGQSSESSSSSDEDSMVELECPVCDKTFWDIPTYKEHVNGKKHRSRLLRLKSLESSDGNKSDDDSSPVLKCSDCKLVFEGHIPYVSHMQGSKHLKNLKKQALKREFLNSQDVNNDADDDDEQSFTPVAYCPSCDKKFYELIQYKQHLSCSAHKKKLQEKKILEALVNDGEDNEVDDDYYKRCEICDKTMNSPISYRAHMNSSVHFKTLKRIEAEKKIEGFYKRDDSKFICKECDKVFPDPFSFQDHLDNDSHKKYEKKKKIMEFVEKHPEIVVNKTIQNIVSGYDNEEEYRIGDLVLACKLCHKSLVGPESAKKHIESKKHLKIKNEREIAKKLVQNQLSKPDSANGHSSENKSVM